MTFIRDALRWNLRVAYWNLRFRVGYKIGGFTSAHRLRHKTAGGVTSAWSRGGITSARSRRA